MSNETKQPTLPEAIALAREALTNCEGMIDELRDYPVTHDSIIEALAALDSLQVGEPSVSDSELAQRILTVLGYATEPSMEPGADERRDRIAEIIASNAAPCARCAELEASEFELIKQRDVAEDYGTKLANAVSEFFRVEVGEYSNMNDPREVALDILEGGFITDSDADRKIAALEAENARLIERFELAVETKTQQQATIAQQAEQLAAAERDACALWMMLDDIDTGGDIAKADDVLYRAIAEHSHKRRFEPRFEWVIKAIDAAIAARKGEK